MTLPTLVLNLSSFTVESGAVSRRPATDDTSERAMFRPLPRNLHQEQRQQASQSLRSGGTGYFLVDDVSIADVVRDQLMKQPEVLKADLLDLHSHAVLLRATDTSRRAQNDGGLLALQRYLELAKLTNLQGRNISKKKASEPRVLKANGEGLALVKQFGAMPHLDP